MTLGGGGLVAALGRQATQPSHNSSLTRGSLEGSVGREEARQHSSHHLGVVTVTTVEKSELPALLLARIRYW